MDRGRENSALEGAHLLLTNAKKHKHSSHRGRLDIIADILSASLDGVKKTHLMYRCNLSFRQLKRYLRLLVGKGFLYAVSSDSPDLFETSDKGKKFLKAYEGLRGLME